MSNKAAGSSGPSSRAILAAVSLAAILGAPSARGQAPVDQDADAGVAPYPWPVAGRPVPRAAAADDPAPRPSAAPSSARARLLRATDEGRRTARRVGATGDHWTLVLAPYVWASGIEGEIGVRGRTSEVDLGFGELIEKVDGAFYLAMEARRRRWGIATELMLVELSDQAGAPGPLFTGVEVSAQQTFFELTPRYRMFVPDPVALDLILGARLWALGNKLRFTADTLSTLLVEAGERWLDPVLGLRAIAPLGERWLLQARGDVGGFDVGSRLTWQILGLGGFRVGDAVTIRAGYRHLDVDFETADDGFIFNVGLGGLIMGATIGL